MGVNVHLYFVASKVAAAETGVGDDAVPGLADDGSALAEPSLFRRESEEDLLENVIRQIGHRRRASEISATLPPPPPPSARPSNSGSAGRRREPTDDG